MEIKTPEQILGIKPKKIEYHNGTCYLCNKKFVLVMHLNYHKQPNRDFCICKNCFNKLRWDL